MVSIGEFARSGRVSVRMLRNGDGFPEPWRTELQEPVGAGA